MLFSALVLKAMPRAIRIPALLALVLALHFLLVFVIHAFITRCCEEGSATRAGSRVSEMDSDDTPFKCRGFGRIAISREGTHKGVAPWGALREL
eukprot:COSAG02_NODE_4718_length_5059_cov_6.717540_3_plen_94_part_00